MGGRAAKRYFLCILGTLALFAIFYHLQSPCFSVQPQAVMVSHPRFLMGNDAKRYQYDRNMPLIFIGGMPRSGTTLLRVLLDAHPDIRCGEETRVIPRLLSIRQQWLKAPIESKRLQEAGISGPVLDSAVAAFILEIIARHGEPAPRLCNKDPFTLRSAVYLNSLFPSSKFVFMIRDGRAVVHSIITRKVTISGFDLTDYRQCLKKWNAAMQSMHVQCQTLGPSVCLPVYYEQLVLHPRRWMERILQFLEVPWNDTVLHHEQFVNRPGGISLSKLERSTDQVIKPINIEALSKWVGNIPEDVVRDMAIVAPMLNVLGYDPHANPPDYGKPDTFVMRNTKEILENREVWVAKELEVIRARESLKGSALRHNQSKNGSDGKGAIAVKGDSDDAKWNSLRNSKKGAHMQLENPIVQRQRRLLGIVDSSARTRLGLSRNKSKYS